MVNPSFPKYQMVGVFNLELARMYGYLYQNTDKTFSILHALDGYDEISLTGDTKVIGNTVESVLRPQDLSLEPLRPGEIYGGETVAEAAGVFMNVLQGRGTTAQEAVVCANAGVAIATANGSSPQEGFEKAKESLKSGNALKAFKRLQELSA
jgi:anthranilate phosphoribosyltransferase